jgi:cytosolic carboxypeptidase protein 2/3
MRRLPHKLPLEKRVLMQTAKRKKKRTASSVIDGQDLSDRPSSTDSTISSESPKDEILVYSDGVQLHKSITILFDSHFESGNLSQAYKRVDDFDSVECYSLLLSNDTNSYHSQWFYFHMSNLTIGKKYQFDFLNFKKPKIEESTQPVMFINSQWTRIGEDIKYFKTPSSSSVAYSQQAKGIENFFADPDDEEIDYLPSSPSSTLILYTFSFKFVATQTEGFFAYSYPYTFSDLRRFLNRLEDDETRDSNFHRSVLCRTRMGHNCEILTVTNSANRGSSGKILEKRLIIVTSRVHPGETPGSFVVQGLIDFLTGNTSEAKFLRDKFVFKIVPMLNIDGVVLGNTRCDSQGIDMNRSWSMEDGHGSAIPEILALRGLVDSYFDANGTKFHMFIDLHAHSKRSNIFAYGNPPSKTFLKLLSQQCVYFSFDGCSFLEPKGSKMNTARAAMSELAEISLTIESSFSGADFGRFEGFLFNPNHYIEFGKSVGMALYDSCDLQKCFAATVG